MQAITRNELKLMNDIEQRDFILINVLPRDMFNRSHIRSSINIPLDSEDFLGLVETVAGDKARDVVVYCDSFECKASDRAAKKLEEAGFARVYDYEGGNRDWFDETRSRDAWQSD